MAKKPQTYRLAERTFTQIEELQEFHAFESATAVLEYAVNKEHKAVIKPYLERDEDGLFWLSSDGKLVECHYRSEGESRRDMRAAGYVPLFQVVPISSISIDKSINPHFDELSELYIEAIVKNTVVLDDKDTVLVNVGTDEKQWAEIISGDESDFKIEIAEEGTEYFCPKGLYVVEDDNWKEIECFHIDEHVAYYVEGGKPALYLFKNEETYRGEQGRLYEVEGAALRVADDGMQWEWVEEDDQ